MNTDRRQVRQVRKAPDTLVFIQLDQDDGGRVLNVSEGGLSFEAFAPVHQNGPMRFWFSLDLLDRIEAVGEITWTDPTRKIGGLRFLDLSPVARGQIRSWITRHAEPDGIAPKNCGAEAHTALAFPMSTQLVPLERHRSATRQQLIRGIFLGILISSAVVIPFVKYSDGRKQVATPQPASGVTTLANSEAQSGLSASVSGPGLDASRRSIASGAAKTQPSARLDHLTDNPAGSPLVVHRQQSFDPSAERSSVPTPALRQSRATRDTKKSVASLQQLWSAVQGGNAQAALTLADLYLRGEGVPVNCDQARVLLLVASKKGNAQAIEELQALDKTGCPAPAP